MAKNILHIDSDMETQDRVAKYLSTQGFVVSKHYKGKTALDAIEKNSPDLIVLSVELADMNGYVLCKQVKTHPKIKKIPLILTSSEASPEDFEKHSKLKSRADKYLLKPFDNEELSLKIHNLLEGREKPQEVEIEVEEEAPKPPPKKKAPSASHISEDVKRELERLKEEVISLSRGKSELEAKISGEKARIKELEEKLAGAKRALDKNREDTEEYKVRYKKISEERDRLRAEMDKSSQLTQEAEEHRLEAEKLSHEIDTLHKKIDKIEKENADYRKGQDDLKTQVDTLMESLTNAQSVNEKLELEAQKVKEAMTALEQQEHVSEDMEAKFLAQEEEYKEKLSDMEETVKRAHEELSALDKSLEDSAARCKILEGTLAEEKDKSKAQRSEMEKSIVLLRETIHRQEEEIEICESLTARILVLEQETDERKKYNDETLEKLGEILKERDDFRHQCEVLVEQHQNALEEMDGVYEEKENILNREISALKEKFSIQENEGHSLLKNIENLTKEKDSLMKVQQALSGEKDALHRSYTILQTEAAAVKENLRKTEEALHKAESYADSLQNNSEIMNKELSSLKETLKNNEGELEKASAQIKILQMEKETLNGEAKALKEQGLTMEKNLLEMGALNERVKALEMEVKVGKERSAALERGIEEAIKQRDEYYQHSVRMYEDAEKLRKELETAYSSYAQGTPSPASGAPLHNTEPQPFSGPMAPISTPQPQPPPEPPPFEESFEELESDLEDLEK